MKDNTLLTPHFTEQEFIESATAQKYGIDNRPTPEVVANLMRLCIHTLEPLREKLGLPIIITSGYRTKALNDIIVHASRKSQHMSGCAADFMVQGSNQHELLIKAFRLIIEDESVDFDQLILYPNFIHVSYVSKETNRHNIMTAQGDGKYCAITRADALSLM